MSRLTVFLDWLDEAAGGLIRLAYLAAGITAVAVYFGADHLPLTLEYALNASLPWVLASAIETHTYLTARRVRAAWQDRQAAPRHSATWEQANGALSVNSAVLAVLLAFSAWNQLGYLATTWRPQGTAFALPDWSAYLVRALIVPTLFMAAAFLAPLPMPIGAQIEAEGRATLTDVFKIARKQRRRLLREAARSGRDMTGALVELVPDLEARRTIAHIYGAIRGEPMRLEPTDEISACTTPLPSSRGRVVTTERPELINGTTVPNHQDAGPEVDRERKRVHASSPRQRKSRETSTPSMEANRQPDSDRSNVRTLPFGTEIAHSGPSARANTGRSLADTHDLQKRREFVAEQIMSTQPGIGPRELRRQLESRTGKTCSASIAQALYNRYRDRSA